MELTRHEYETRLAELQNQLEELKSANITITDEPWEPQMHEKYWFVSAAGLADSVVDNTTWENWGTDRNRKSIGNIFASEEDAKFFAEKLCVYNELRKFTEPKTRPWDLKTMHYYISCECDRFGHFDSVTPNESVCYGRGAELYFESKERAEEAINAVGADRVKKYYLNIDD